MANIKLLQKEEKGASIYSFSYGYLDKNQELKWVEGAVEASRRGNDWTFNFSKVENQTQAQFDSYRSMLEKVNQVVEHGGNNLSGITVEKPKPVAAAKAE